MYYEERILDGVMCWRSRPDAVFVPYSIEELSARYDLLKALIYEGGQS